MRTIIITGIARGLGRSLFTLLCETNNNMICIDKEFPIQDNASRERVIYLQRDLSRSSFNISELDPMIQLQTKEIIFINNAAVIEPIGKVGQIRNASIIASTFINYISPMLISNMLVMIADRLHLPLRILNISSGAAQTSFPGWSLYCSTKCGMKMFYDCMQKEGQNIIVRHIDPGVMDTQIQEQIRNASLEQFPLRDKFIEYKEKNILKKPEDVARQILTKEGLL